VASWSAWLISLVQPIVLRVMTALGIGYLTYEGAKGALIAVLEQSAASFGGLIGEASAILARSGFFLAMSIVSGGIIGGLAYGLTKRLAVLSEGESAPPSP
jgi:hypothetical protein